MIRRCRGEQVADEFAAALGEDRGTAGQTCALLLAALGRRAPDSETVREHAQDDGGAAGAGRLGNAGRWPTRAGKSSSSDKCQQRGRREAGNKPRKAPEEPERAAMPPQTGHGDSSLTAGGVGVWITAKGRFNTVNSDSS